MLIHVIWKFWSYGSVTWNIENRPLALRTKKKSPKHLKLLLFLGSPLRPLGLVFLEGKFLKSVYKSLIHPEN